MLRQVKKVAPNSFRYCGPSCVNGSCSEGKITCGNAEKIRKKYAINQEK